MLVYMHALWSSEVRKGIGYQLSDYAIEKYEAALLDQRREDKKAIIVSSSTNYDIRLVESMSSTGKEVIHITSAQFFDNYAIDGDLGIVTKGMLLPRDLGILEELAFEEDLTFNGMMYGRCPTDLAVQLLYLRKYKEYYPVCINNNGLSNFKLTQLEKRRLKTILSSNPPEGWRYGVAGTFSLSDLVSLGKERELTLKLTKDARIHLLGESTLFGSIGWWFTKKFDKAMSKVAEPCLVSFS